MPVLLREAVGSLPLKQLAVALDPLWRRMKLRPRIESQRHPTAYLLQVRHGLAFYSTRGGEGKVHVTGW